MRRHRRPQLLPRQLLMLPFYWHWYPRSQVQVGITCRFYSDDVLGGRLLQVPAPGSCPPHRSWPGQAVLYTVHSTYIPCCTWRISNKLFSLSID